MVTQINAQMTYRYLRKKKWEISLVIITVVFLYLWTDGFGTSSIPVEYDFQLRSMCSFPCIGQSCIKCESDRIPTTVKTVDIVNYLNLRQAVHNGGSIGNMQSHNATVQEQVCRRPNFDLKHDSVKYAFYSMKKLNCSKEELFHIENNVFKFNLTKLAGRELEKCMYYGIERASDDYAAYTEALTKESPPYDLILKHDFVRIKCFLKKDEEENDDSDDLVLHDDDENNENGNKLKRKLLSVETKFPKLGSGIAEFEIHLHNKNNTSRKSHNLNDNNLIVDHESHNGNRSSSVIYKSESKLNNGIKHISQENVTKGKESSKGDNLDVSRLIAEDESSHKKLHKNFSSLNLYRTESRENGENVPHIYGKRNLKNENEVEVNDVDDAHDMEQDTHEDNAYDDSDNHYWYDPFYNVDENDGADFDQLLVQVTAKSEVFDRISKISPKTNFQDRPNILMFGLDSMSHLSYQRKLPKTYQYLKETMGAVIMDGYNIVGDATTAALIPILTGKSETELPETRKNRIDSVHVDIYPFIWNKYKNAGYVTMYAEDEPSIGVFNLRLNGFQNQPTDHYMRPFWQALWDSPVRRDSPRYCTGNVPNHMYLLNYTKDFFDAYQNVSKFAFVFGSELTHWDNNPGEYMDQDFVDFFEYFRKKGYLDNTIVIAYGDHGARYSRVRNTVQGKMEERLPMMSLTFPAWFKQKYSKLYENLVRNSDRLATPFDIHETLEHILRLSNEIKKEGKDSDFDKQKDRKIIPREWSLLHPIPPERTCSSAHIDIHWCTCLKQLDLDGSDKHVQKSVNALVKFINKETKTLRDLCVELKYHSLHHAYLLVPNEKVLMFQRSKDDDNRVANFSRNINVDHAHFQITIETSPNKGLFESTVQVNMTAGTYTVMESQVSRLDRYGSQPACVQDKHPDLRKYCYCKRSG